MTSPVTGIAGVFDRAADSYDDVGVPWFGPIAQGLVDELAVRPGERVVDLGCGRGAALVRLAEATGPTGTALGLDLAPRMVERTAADVAHLPHVAVRVADVSAPGLPPSSCDVLASSLVLFFLPDPAAAVRTWVPALAPGGRLGVTTFAGQDPRWAFVDELFLGYLSPALREARRQMRDGVFATDGGVERLLHDAGLVDVRTVHREVEAVFSGPEHWLAFSWSHGQRALWEQVPEDERAAVRDRAVAHLEGLRETGGALRLTAQVRHTLGRRA